MSIADAIPTKRAVGRPKLKSRRTPFVEQFNLPSWKDREHKISCKLVTQLENCADDSARRLILGIGEKELSGDTGNG